MAEGVVFEQGQLGVRAVLTQPWSPEMLTQLSHQKPAELELNTAKGWRGKDIGFVRDCAWLQSFTIIDMSIQDIEPIHLLIGLRDIVVSTYCKTALKFERFPNLESCSLEWRKGSESLFECRGLKKLFLNRYAGHQSEPFGRLANLRSLAILNSPLEEVRAFSNLCNLNSLRLGRLLKLNSLEGLGAIQVLDHLEVSGCKRIDSIEPLTGLQELTYLNISDCGPVKSLSPIRCMPNLKTILFYESTNIVDGDLSFLDAEKINRVAFMQRRHYNRRRSDLGSKAI